MAAFSLYILGECLAAAAPAHAHASAASSPAALPTPLLARLSSALLQHLSPPPAAIASSSSSSSVDADGAAPQGPDALVAAACGSLLLATYRHSMVAADDASLFSDVGWGCTWRSTQTLLVNACLRCGLGPRAAAHLIADLPEAALGLQALLAASSLSQGSWAGPSATCAAVLKIAAFRPDELPFRVVLATDATVAVEELREALQRPPLPRPVLLLVPARLGLALPLPRGALSRLVACLRLPAFAGCISGRPRHSVFLCGALIEGPAAAAAEVAATAEDLAASATFVALDPHTLQAACAGAGDADVDAFVKSLRPEAATLQPEQLDPTLAIAFLLRSEAELDAWRRALEAEPLLSSPDASLLSVVDQRPRYSVGDAAEAGAGAGADAEAWSLL